MNAFTLSSEQLARTIGAACADEVARRFDRHYDFLTIASWSEETPLGDGGLGLKSAEVDACAERAASFFGVPNDTLTRQKDLTIADWVREMADAVSEQLTTFTFKAAARDEATATHRHDADEVYQAAAAAANLLYGRRRLLSLVAPHSLLGFALTVLTPNLQRIESVDVRGATPEQLSETMSFGDVLVATPTLWRYVMREELRAPDNTMAVSFGEPMTRDLAASMRRAGFGVMREIYGSTESGLVGWRDAPEEPFVMFDHWRKSGEEFTRIAPNGDERCVPPMDRLEWRGDRGFCLLGRRDGAVQIRGVNVFPEAVAATMRDHKTIDQCTVRVGRRGDGVRRLIAHIVLKKGKRPTDRIAREIDLYCRSKLRQEERPRIYRFEASLSNIAAPLDDAEGED
ncbi:MAG: hypothetical protein AAGC77_02725 [Pseudomonadota bacterium]